MSDNSVKTKSSPLSKLVSRAKRRENSELYQRAMTGAMRSQQAVIERAKKISAT
ncbi:hypothetical protein [Oceanospirillum sediminis]|uniref:Uncharacterized protein n=1 Tax=Oceanospirillum sediminis TaxID=2760088 RepID=A0A839IVM6_9GAMM|nr:hypothetical protein [Oceanospirillum sediminis]MBB1489483.1 hypothetical protein [Oceanospirillum sediminis]